MPPSHTRVMFSFIVPPVSVWLEIRHKCTPASQARRNSVPEEQWRSRKQVLRSAQDDKLRRNCAAASGKVAISTVSEPLLQTQPLVVIFLVNHNISHFVP